VLAGNLSSRPFYNERLVSFALALVALAALVFSAWTVTTIMRLSETRANLDREVAQNRSDAERIRADVQAVTAGVDLTRLQSLAAGVDEANALITQRTFSWTRFFDLIEGAMPYEVRLVAVAQRLEKGGQLLTLNLISQSDTELNELVRAMLATGAFYDVLPTEKTTNDDGTLGAVVESYYLPPPATPDNGGTTPAGGGRP
jgi:Tfp pilus assembly protein PilN